MIQKEVKNQKKNQVLLKTQDFFGKNWFKLKTKGLTYDVFKTKAKGLSLHHDFLTLHSFPYYNSYKHSISISLSF